MSIKVSILYSYSETEMQHIDVMALSDTLGI